MIENRRAARPRTFLKAEIDLNGISVLPCVVRDLSDDGARLFLSEHVVLPHTFRIRLPKPDRWASAQVKWRRGEDVGVSLRLESATEPAGGDVEVRLRKLEAENARLRRLLDELRRDPSRLQELLDPAAA